MPGVSQNLAVAGAKADTSKNSPDDSPVQHTVELGDQLVRKIVKNSRAIQILKCRDDAAQKELFQGRYHIMYKQYNVLFDQSLINHPDATIVDDYDSYSAHLKVTDSHTGEFLGGCRVVFLKDLPPHLISEKPGIIFPKMYEHTHPILPVDFDVTKSCVIGYVFGKNGVGNCNYKNLVSTLGDLLFRESFQHAVESGCRWILLTCKPYMYSYLLSYGFEAIDKTFPLNGMGEMTDAS